jgi:hypothetical protein
MLLIFNLNFFFPSTHPLRLVKRNNTCTTRITATAGTRICRCLPLLTFIIISKVRVLRLSPSSLLWSRRVTHLAHCPQFCTAAFKRSRNRISVFVWLSIHLDTAKHVWIGKLLPYQLPNTLCVYLNLFHIL